jgi:hypothetical protein
MRASLILVTALAAAGASQADVDHKSLHGAAGLWRLSETGGKVACTLTLTAEPAGDALEVRLPLACRRAFPPLGALSTWAYNSQDGIVLSDSKRQRIVALPGPEGGPYEGKAPDGKTWRLETADLPKVVGADGRLSGAYRLTGQGGATLCDLSFSADIFGVAGRIAPGPCASGWADKGFAAWTLRAGRLTLLDRARKPILVLKPGEAGAFVPADPKGDPVSLLRR